MPLPHHKHSAVQVIDENHNCFTIKYLRNKPVRELKGDEMLRLHLAEQDHLLEIKLAIDPEQSQEVKRSVSTAGNGSHTSKSMLCTCKQLFPGFSNLYKNYVISEDFVSNHLFGVLCVTV